MRVLSKPVLVQFWAEYPDAKVPLGAWHDICKHKDFGNFAALKNTFGSVDKVDDFVVFNIGGNKHRPVATVHYNRRMIFICHVLTPKDYDDGSWKKRR